MISPALAAAKQAVEGGERAAIEAATAALTHASHKMAEALYKQASAGAPPPGGAPPGSGEGPGPGRGDGGVIVAEVVDKK